MKLFVFIGLLGLCWAEAPFQGYAPSGWTPSGPQLKLPTEYGAPVQETGASEIEITKENIEYAGQLGETTTYANPSNAYLPPDDATTTTDYPVETEDPLRVQGLPSSKPANFKNLNRGEITPARSGQLRQQPLRFQQQQQFQQQRVPQIQRGPQPQFFQQQRVAQRGPQQQFRANLRQAPRSGPRANEFAEFIPQAQVQQQTFNNFRNGRLQAPPQRQNFNRQQFGRQEIAEVPEPEQPAPEQPATEYGAPAPEYGPPAQTYGPPAEEYGPPTTTVQPETEQPEDYDEPEEDSEDEPAIAISNASSGQYYILAPDNTLQKVQFMTSQTEDDKRSKGFTAQLRYAPVEPIRDPIYAYNQLGQLVRIYNKKK